MGNDGGKYNYNFAMEFVLTHFKFIESLHPYYSWASEASPTLGCSIEISHDIYIYVYIYVCRYVPYVKLTA